MDGVLNLLKPAGMTSHDVVDSLRRVTGQRRVGHTGTLDPGAAGVLVLVVGRATRIAEFLTLSDKAYRVEVTFGRATDSGDAFGTQTSERDASALAAAALQAVLPRFTGTIRQVPPLTSAIKVEGRRLYQFARRGEHVEVAPREVTIHRLVLLRFTPGPAPRALLDVECSKGTYVRALARDIGDVLEVGAFASFMLRTRVGRFGVSESLTLEELRDTEGVLAERTIPMDQALDDLPAVDLLPAHRQQILDGVPLPLFKLPDWQRIPIDRPLRLRDQQGLLAVARVESGRIQPFKVLRDRR
jgi:tRNA pseudouridine55 synthase